MASSAEQGMDETRDGTHTDHEGMGGGSAVPAGAPGGHPSMRLVSIDHDEYDALAELFLGGGGMAPEPPASESLADSPALQLTARDEPMPPASGVVDIHERSSPSSGVEKDARRVMASLQETDEHASRLMDELMGYGQEDAEAGIDFVRLPRAQVEVIVLGHLPVRATLWARQYACASAKSRGEVVALVRAASGSTAIDLITGREPLSVSGSSDLQGALQTLHERADRVVLRVDERCEPELLERPEVGVITVLTGADEAAVVASYRLVKTIDATLRERYDGADEGPALRIAVMGASQDQAEDALDKLRNAVDSFIERPVEIVIGSARIDATGTTNIFRDSVAHHAGDLIDGLVAIGHQSELQSSSSSVTGDAGASGDGAEGRSGVVEGGEARGRSTESGPIRSARRVRDGLCALIEGVRPIETRCPKAPGVEMGTDDEGRLHLLACDADCEVALERLYVAQNWARDHLGLLLRAEPGLRFPSSDPHEESEAVMHLMSHEPAALRGLYDTRVRMYALARVRVGGVVAQVATPLN